MPGLPVRNFTSDWRDGRAIGALVDGVAPGQYHVQVSAVRQNFPTLVSRCRLRSGQYRQGCAAGRPRRIDTISWGNLAIGVTLATTKVTNVG